VKRVRVGRTNMNSPAGRSSAADARVDMLCVTHDRCACDTVRSGDGGAFVGQKLMTSSSSGKYGAITARQYSSSTKSAMTMLMRVVVGSTVVSQGA
jgi:hypothetical protein